MPFMEMYLIGDSPSDLKYIANDTKIYTKGTNTRAIFKELFGDGIFTADGTNWTFQRKTAMKLFNRNNYIKFLELFYRKYDQLKLNIENNLQHPIEMEKKYYQYTMDMFCNIAFGEKVNTLGGEYNPFSEAFDYTVNYISVHFFWPYQFKQLWLYTPSGRKYTSMIKTMNDYVYNLVDNIFENKQDLENRYDILSLFFKHENESDVHVTKDFLRDIIVNLMIAGRDTTAQSLSWATYNLCKHQEIQQKLHQEVMKMYADKKQLSLDELTDPVSSKYLSGVIAESLRLYTTIPKNVKYIEKDDNLPSGCPVKKGGVIGICSYMFGRSEKIWGDPHNFRPERHFETVDGVERFKFPDQYQMPTFNSGKRICIGKEFALLEMRCILSSLVRDFKFKIEDGFVVKIKDNIGLPMQNGINVVFEKRNED